MEPKPLDAAGLYKLQYTASGSPYIAIPSRSSMPIYLTMYYANDAPAAHSILTIPAVNLALVSVPLPYTLADAEWWVKNQIAGPSTANLPLQILRSGSPGEDGTLIGSVSLMPPDSEVLTTLRENKALPDSLKEATECELGYYLNPAWQGKGIMKSGVKALLAWARAEAGVKAVIVRAVEDNSASRRVIEGLGDEYFVRTERLDYQFDWPEKKGGGRKKLLTWRWNAS
jgi:RimJ/RimL family protein N-acetyltransferase